MSSPSTASPRFVRVVMVMLAAFAALQHHVRFDLLNLSQTTLLDISFRGFCFWSATFFNPVSLDIRRPMLTPREDQRLLMQLVRPVLWR